MPRLPEKAINIVKRSNRGLFLLALVIVFASLWFAGVVYAASNISRQSAEHWAWNDAVGWIQFNTTISYPEMTVNVISAQLQGYASSSAGEVSVDCATTSAGDICSPRLEGEGVVVAVSPFSRNAKQREVPVTVHVGDCILFDARPGGVEEVGDLGVDGEVHYVMGEPAVLAVLED